MYFDNIDVNEKCGYVFSDFVIQNNKIYYVLHTNILLLICFSYKLWKIVEKI